MPTTKQTVKVIMRISRVGNSAGLSGFTLIEALLSVMLFAMLATLVLPGFQSAYEHVKLKDSVRTFTATLRVTRAKAIGTNTAQSVQLYFHENRFATKPDESVIELPKSIKLRAENNAATIDGESLGIVFYPSGGSSGGQVLFYTSTKYYLVSVSPITGRVNVESVAAIRSDAS